jgi:hypothetical protein
MRYGSHIAEALAHLHGRRQPVLHRCVYMGDDNSHLL